MYIRKKIKTNKQYTTGKKKKYLTPKRSLSRNNKISWAEINLAFMFISTTVIYNSDIYRL